MMDLDPTPVLAVTRGVDWWHWGTVTVLVGALLLEAVAAYCRQNASIELGPRGYQLGRVWWQWLWLVPVGPDQDGMGEPHERRHPALRNELASLLRGVSRLLSGALFLVRVAAKQPALPIVDLGF